MDYFNFIAVFELVFRMPTFRHDASIHFYSNAALGVALLLE